MAELIGVKKQEGQKLPLLSTEWRVFRERPGKRILVRYNPATDELEFLEEWLNEVPLTQAKQEREIAWRTGKGRTSEFAPVCVIPQSVVSESIRDGWHDDEAKWRRWINDSDNRNLRITEGRY